MNTQTILNDVVQALYPLVLALVSYGMHQLTQYIKSKKSLNQALQKDGWAYKGVILAEQSFECLGGYGKYQKAAEYISNMCKKHGVKISDKELEGLIETALTQFKKDFDIPIKSKSVNNSEINYPHEVQ
ncbi:phage holin [Aneurinibacillus migulanus]|uniref:phage holin n=1 Tax=Aneurinibacillus migulanus TaxID=47500 RepID=UPI00209CA871|nr:phage holin [Aneurinibacillus migulanus]MCP1357742.1 phage holin [Aneurinibacillus migulanus]